MDKLTDSFKLITRCLIMEKPIIQCANVDHGWKS